MLSDFRVAGRALRKSPGFAATAIAALALGIGANAAIFSMVNQILLNPAGVARPDRVVALRAKYDKLNLRNISVSTRDFADVRDSRDLFEHAAIINQADFNYQTGDTPERLQGGLVTAEWFDLFGAKPALGRVFTPEEDQPEANRVIVLAYPAWQRLFGSDPGAVGKTITLNDRPYQIVGIMGRDFRFPRNVDLWSPLGLPLAAYGENNRFNESYTGYARLRDGVSFERANAFMNILSDRLKNSGTRGAAYAKDSQWGIFALPITDFLAGDTKRPLVILLCAVGFVLLIACSNIAGLMLARTSGRTREIAVRAALGAGRWALMRQTIAESLLLASAGAVFGLALAVAGIRLLLLLAPGDAAIGVRTSLDGSVLLFTAAATIVSALLFGLVPAWQIANIDTHEVLKGTGRSGMSGRGRQRLRSVLVVCETALALMLLVGAGLFIRSLARIEDVRPGFEPRGVMTASITLSRTRYPDNPKRLVVYRTIIDRLTSTPGVTSAAAAINVPFTDMGGSGSFQIREKPTGPGDPGPHGGRALVSPGYFQAMTIPLKTGRYFNDQDVETAEKVAVIDENLARQYWPGENPIGQHITFPGPNNWARIVGIVGHVHQSDLAADSGKGVYYWCTWQFTAPMTQLVVKTQADPAAFTAAIRDAVRAVDPAQPVSQLKTLEDLVSASLASRRFVVRILGFFAVVALLMAALGLYGVISYSVSQRTQEIGIRVALGAPRDAVLKLVVGQGVRLAAFGAALGLVASIACSRWLKSQLFEVSAFDPLTFATMALVLVAAAFAASYVPARRAMKVYPSEALRYE
jgi:putative ABC transport system permease protein